MVGRVLELEDIIEPDNKATKITDTYLYYKALRLPREEFWEEVRRYVYATDTRQTTNAQLPWKNSTTIPKICQIVDNLHSNYFITLFPTNKRKWLRWEGDNKDANTPDKIQTITNYMNWVIEQPSFKVEIDKVIYDYIFYGNCFLTVDWMDERVEQPDKTQTGYVGPVIRRISPLDIVFNPTSENFEHTPKIVRSLISLGELKDLLSSMSNDENRDTYEELWKYLYNLRSEARAFQGEWNQRDNMYSVDGFGSFRDYLSSDTVEILTFYGDLYDSESDEFLKNHVITIVDRHKVISQKPNPSFFGYPPIFHSAWRKRQDNLWGMGALDNLVGMQYRLDHVENMRADIADFVTYPVQLITGYVDDYTWQPGEKIWAGEDGNLNIVQPDVNLANLNFEMELKLRLMEEMAGAPREAMGFRTPGEKTAYEVQRLENAGSRIYQNRIAQFSENPLEKSLNAMLELARRNMVGVTTIKVLTDEFNQTTFQELTVDDITGAGRIKPLGARHFAEQAELIQNFTNLTNSGLWPTVQPHFSSYKLAKVVEDVFDIKDYEVVSEWAILTEQAEAQKYQQALQENMLNYTGTASGLGEDFDLEGTGQDINPQNPPEGQSQGQPE